MRVTFEQQTDGEDQNQRCATHENEGIAPATGQNKNACHHGKDELSEARTDLDDAGHHAPVSDKPSGGGAQCDDINRAEPNADKDAVKEI